MAAPNLKEIEWYIDRLEHSDIPDSGYVLLGALYIIREHMAGEALPAAVHADADRESAPLPPALDGHGESEFLQAVAGVPADAAWGVMDELMETLRAVNPRVYASVMRKLEAL